MNGNRSHLLCRPVFKDDAKEKQSRLQAKGNTGLAQGAKEFSGILLDTGPKSGLTAESLDGEVVTFEPGRELTFESDWIPNQGWLQPTLMTIRLTAALEGTLVELTHHRFEETGPRASEDHADYETGWGMTQLRALREVVQNRVGPA